MSRLPTLQQECERRKENASLGPPAKVVKHPGAGREGPASSAADIEPHTNGYSAFTGSSLHLRSSLELQERIDRSPRVNRQAKVAALANQDFPTPPVQNITGMPDQLKAGIENLSGFDLSGIRVNYNSARPARLNALAFAQGQNIELGPGQERHLPHEAWHVVQQMQGRVKATTQSMGFAINDDATLEREADLMGGRAVSDHTVPCVQENPPARLTPPRLQVPLKQDTAPLQLKGWIWRKSPGNWEEVDKEEQGRKVPSHVKGTDSDDGAVYDADTDNWYANVNSYRQHTSPLSNPAFVSKKQTSDDATLLKQESEDSRIAPATGAESKLTSFLAKGVLTPSAARGGVTTSADETARNDQISVNKFGPFESEEDADKTARYAATNPANGAVPVAMENSADHLEDAQDPDLHALATRAHNSALAVIDPSGLSGAIQAEIKLASTGEMTLTSTIPSSCFVAVLIPIQLQGLISTGVQAKFNIVYVGSRDDTVSFNFKTTGKKSSSLKVNTTIPDYEGALKDIFRKNKDSVFLTHVIRLSPTISIPVTSRGAGSSSGSSKTNSSKSPNEDSKISLGESKVSLPVPTPTVVAMSSQPDKSIPEIAGAVRDKFQSANDLSETNLRSKEDLLAFAALGVTQANAAAVWAELEDDVTWLL